MASILYIVATPIGNLQDISLRAVEVLKNADYIACEDKRITKILLDKYSVNTKLIDYHKFNEKERSEKILEKLREGSDVVLVSDAGTPLISDPGKILVDELYKNNVKITSIPGACALTVFLSLLPRKTEEFAFIGFIPRTFNQQNEILNKYKYINCVFYESPNRLLQTLENIMKIFGENKKIAVGRELTKVYEEVKIGSVREIIDYYNENTLKGEIAVMVFEQENVNLNDDFLNDKIKMLKEEGFSPKDISKIITKLYGVNKNKIYKLALN